MLIYATRRIIIAIPTLLIISFIIFLILALAPGDPTSNLPLTVPSDVREQIRDSFGLNQPLIFRYIKWLHQFFINEPLSILNNITGFKFFELQNNIRLRSWMTSSPVADLIIERLPQTLWVIGLSYFITVVIALPLGVLSAYWQYSWFDHFTNFVSIIGFSIPTFVTGEVVILIFSTYLGWFPSIYDTTHKVTDYQSFIVQLQQITLPVFVLTFYNLSKIVPYMRSSVLQNLNQDYVRTARAKGLKERIVLFKHVFRNSLIPVVTIITLGIPYIFSGAIILEQIFAVNGLGQLLIIAIQSGDIPLVQTLTFVFAILVVFFNLVADLVYAFLDPRISYG
ncbi:ABC transporter permease [Liberibacter crescens]|uniref:ABC transporter permease n=1 Tax=Liberibacter crescens TaxID=1273132 RepID=UPI0005A28FE0|nr:ABC transporter substrate-binding protein [Liberibacter crescens]